MRGQAVPPGPPRAAPTRVNPETEGSGTAGVGLGPDGRYRARQQAPRTLVSSSFTQGPLPAGGCHMPPSHAGSVFCFLQRFWQKPTQTCSKTSISISANPPGPQESFRRRRTLLWRRVWKGCGPGSRGYQGWAAGWKQGRTGTGRIPRNFKCTFILKPKQIHMTAQSVIIAGFWDKPSDFNGAPPLQGAPEAPSSTPPHRRWRLPSWAGCGSTGETRRRRSDPSNSPQKQGRPRAS